MGMYDTVKCKCPECGRAVWIQSKGGDCDLDVYDLDDAPPEVLMGLGGHLGWDCVKCKRKWYAEVECAVKVELHPYEDDEEDAA